MSLAPKVTPAKGPLPAPSQRQLRSAQGLLSGLTGFALAPPLPPAPALVLPAPELPKRVLPPAATAGWPLDMLRGPVPLDPSTAAPVARTLEIALLCQPAQAISTRRPLQQYQPRDMWSHSSFEG